MRRDLVVSNYAAILAVDPQVLKTCWNLSNLSLIFQSAREISQPQESRILSIFLGSLSRIAFCVWQCRMPMGAGDQKHKE
jgi:hypothetical protein